MNCSYIHILQVPVRHAHIFCYHRPDPTEWIGTFPPTTVEVGWAHRSLNYINGIWLIVCWKWTLQESLKNFLSLLFWTIFSIKPIFDNYKSLSCKYASVDCIYCSNIWKNSYFITSICIRTWAVRSSKKKVVLHENISSEEWFMSLF